MSKQNAERQRLFEKFPYIVAWGQMMGSYGYYIEDQCAKAEETNAPADATYWSDTDKTWHTYSACREQLKYDLDEYRAGRKGGIIFN